MYKSNLACVILALLLLMPTLGESKMSEAELDKLIEESIKGGTSNFYSIKTINLDSDDLLEKAAKVQCHFSKSNSIPWEANKTLDPNESVDANFDRIFDLEKLAEDAGKNFLGTNRIGYNFAYRNQGVVYVVIGGQGALGTTTIVIYPFRLKGTNKYIMVATNYFFDFEPHVSYMKGYCTIIE